MQGIIYKILSNFYYVKIGNEIIECKAKGKFKNEETDLIVGDNVIVEKIDNDKGNIIEVLPRKNKLKRPSVANVEKLIILMSIKSPLPDFMLLDKQLAYCVKNNIEPVICITKIDKDINNEFECIKNIYEKIGYPVYSVSAKEGIGIDSLRQELKGCLCVFAGNSGVGKSTLINAIFDKDIMLSGDVSKKTGRGKHTTRHVEIIEHDGLLITDTPGFSLFDISEIKKDELANCFEEFIPYLDKCEYRDCRHIKEENCGIKEAVLEKKISDERYKRFVEIYLELK